MVQRLRKAGTGMGGGWHGMIIINTKIIQMIKSKKLNWFASLHIFLTDLWCTGPPSSNLQQQLYTHKHPPSVLST